MNLSRILTKSTSAKKNRQNKNNNQNKWENISPEKCIKAGWANFLIDFDIAIEPLDYIAIILE